VTACEELIAEAANRITRALGLTTCMFEAFPFDEQLPRIETDRIVLPAAEPGVEPWSSDAGIELPVRFQGLTVGRYVLVPAIPTVGVALPPRARSEAIAIAAEIGEPVAAALFSIDDRARDYSH
jgi:hypothetical protein